MDGQEYSAGNNIGSSSVVFAGASTSFSSSGLTAATIYHYDIFAYNQATPASINYRTAAPLEGNASTLFSEPVNQPTATTFSNLTSVGYTVGFTVATGSPSGYLAIRRAGSSPTGAPVDGTVYTVGTSIGDGVVAYSGSGLSFNETTLGAATVYHYDIFSFNGSGALINYLTTGPLEGSRTTLSTEPAAQPTALIFSGTTSTSQNLSFTAATATGYLVLRKLGSSPTDLPVDGQEYSAGNSIGTSSVVFVGASSSFSSLGLTAATIYHYDIFAYNQAAAGSTNYRAAAPLEGNASTLFNEPVNQPTVTTFSNLTSVGYTVGFTAATGSPSGYLAIRRLGSSPTGAPVDGTAYTAGTSIGDGVVAYSGSSLSFNETTLAAATVYHYDIFSFNGSASLINYLPTNPLEGNRTTLSVEPLSQATALVFSTFTATSYTASFTAAVGSPSGYLVLRTQGALPSGVPVDGTSYSVGNVIGDGTVVSMGASTTFNEAALSPGTSYYYLVFSFNGSADNINYNQATPLSNNTITLAIAPVANAGASFTTTSFMGSWSAVVGADNYSIDVSTDNFATVVAGYNNLSVSGTSQPVSSLNAGTTYQYRIRANNTSGASANSNVISNPTLCTAPITSTATTISSVSFNANWSSVTGAATYSLDVSTDNFVSFVSGYNDLIINSGTSQSVTSLSPSTVYSYRVRANNASGVSANSTAVNVTTLTPGPVATAATTITQTGFTANWSSVVGATDYSLDVGDAGFANFVSGYNNLTVSGTSQLVSALSPSTTYYYRVRANNVTGSSSNSNEISLITIPSNPVATAATNITQTSFSANWSVVAGASGYSLEVTNNSGALLTGFPLTINATTSDVTALSANTAYKYKVKAINVSGASGYSNEVTQSTLVNVPVAGLVTIKNNNSFVAEWQQSAGATGYELDVTLFNSNFSSFVSIYNAFPITGNFTSVLVQGLSPGGAYKFRVRAVGSGGKTDNSNVVGVLLEGGTGNPLAVSNSNPAVSTAIAGSPVSIQTSVSGDAVGQVTVTLFFKKITNPSTSFDPKGATVVSGNNYAANLDDAEMDELGAEYYFRAVDEVNQISQTSVKKMNRIFDSKSSSPVFVSGTFNGSTSHYRMVTVPYKLKSDLVQTVFGDLGEYDRTKWRLGHYQDGQVIELSGTGVVERGLGYWFNAMGNVTLRSGVTEAFPEDLVNPFKLTLTEGWNQIGNPYPFKVDWDDIKNANTSAALGNAFFFTNGLYQTRNTFEVFEGAFVFANAPATIDFPVFLKGTAGGRSSGNDFVSSFGTDNWFVNLNVELGSLSNSFSGLGMHEKANDSKDEFDEMAVPRFNEFLEIRFDHPEYFYPSFSRDIIQTKDKYTWVFSVDSNLPETEAALRWDNSELMNSDAQIYLLDVSAPKFLNMKTDGSYKFFSKGKNEFRVYYSKSPYDVLMPDLLIVGDAFPNPVTEVVNIPVILPDRHDPFSIQVLIFDNQGKQINSIAQGEYRSGIYSLQWDVKDFSGSRVSPGMYFSQVLVDNISTTRKIIVTNR